MIAALCLILVLGIVTTAATRRYIREQAGSDRSLAAGPEAGAMYEAEPFAAEAAGNGLVNDGPVTDGGDAGVEKAAEKTVDTENGETALAEAEDAEGSDVDAGADEPGTSSKKIAGAENPEAEDGVRVQAEGEDSSQSSGNTRRAKRSGGQAAANAAEKQAAGNASEYPVNEGAIASPVENGIVSPAGGAASGAGASSDRTAEDYRDRLSEIENTIQNLETSSNANPTDAMREAAAYEYRLWDAELNQIYQAIMAVLPDEEADTLRGRERRWIRKRDTAAKQAAERYKGGTMENVEYTASLASSTRDRAYELLDLYESYLPAE